jgi:LuxR family maltose regulon positive regulatory protein
MSDHLLNTKLNIPALRPQLVSRSRLIALLSAGKWRPLTVVTAPAGFGKTTLVCEWLREYPRPTAWLSLNEDDDDPTRFFAYFGAALNTVIPIKTSFADALANPQQNKKTALTELLNEVAASAKNFSLVIDDAHFLKSNSIWETLAFILDHLPPNFFFIFTSRHDLPISLVRMQARDRVNLIDEKQLRFDDAEATVFLNEIMACKLSENEISTLVKKTEGWITGLQLAALSINGGEVVAKFIEDFMGTDRLVAEYLFEEVLKRQSDEVHNFLLQTSALERLSGPLCLAVTENDRAQDILTELERANLFIVSIDNQRGWFRYHHLFGELLRDRLQRTSTEQIPQLHWRAGNWFREQKLFIEAIDHFIAAEAYEEAAELIELDCDELALCSTAVKIRGWLDRMPPDFAAPRPLLRLARIAADLVLGNIAEIAPQCEAVEKLMALSNGNVQIQQRVAGELAMYRGYLAELNGNLSEATHHFDQAVSLLPIRNSLLWKSLKIKLDYLRVVSGQKNSSEDARLASSASELSDHETLFTKYAGAQIALLKGDLRAAFALYTDVLQNAPAQLEESSHLLAPAHSQLACILCEWNRIDEAEKQVAEAMRLSEASRNWSALLTAHIAQAMVSQARGKLNEALATIDAALALNERYQIAFLQNYLKAYLAKIWIRKNDLSAAKKLAAEINLHLHDEINPYREMEFLTMARFNLATGKISAAFRLLEKLENAARTTDRGYSLIEILILKALAFDQKSQQRKALAALTEALQLGQSAQAVRLFIDEGEPMNRLLQLAAAEGSEVDYVSQLLTASNHHFSSNGLDQLSEREVQVLRLISAGLSNQQIAQQLFITTGTVKRHVHNLLDKMGVTRRTAATARAREMGLV